MDQQTRLESLVEKIVDVISGIFVALGIWYLILIPFFGFETSFGENLSIVCTFSVASILRGYLFRRLFVWLHNKFGKNFILRFFRKIFPGKQQDGG
jgi:hypothetical protein